MFEKVKDFWSDWGGLIGFCFLILGGVSMIWATHYADTHQTVDVGEGIEVKVAGKCWYLRDDPDAGGSNQFYASNELGFADMSMEPRFTLVNTSEKPRQVSVRSLSAWKVPFRKVVHLQPGEEYDFQVKAEPNSKHWYCWINPEQSEKINLFRDL